MTIEVLDVAEPRAPKKFTITSVEDEKPDGTSERVQSEYVEESWTPYLGPTAVLLARRIDRILAHEHKYAVDIDKWAGSLGVTAEEVTAACHRLVRYGLARWADRDPMLIISRHWPKVPAAIRTPLHRRVLMGLPDVEMTA